MMIKGLKGQVSTEYLIILAVVLVIALVVVLLVSQSTGLGQGSLETQSKASWAGATPFSISSQKASGTSLQVSMTNMGLDKLTVTSISGNSFTTTAFTQDFASGQNQVLSVTLAATCGAVGTQYQYDNVTITYTQGALAGLKQVGAKPLVGRCA
ncbi:MAG: hypothetical protein Q7S22_06785 [Candidatus Micrarchaeota archaeon]|nr:hypothetical protein [Candidatus Micrarchaeota archaeon]